MSREQLVFAAASFLSSPKVLKYPDHVKEKFLSEKGLKPEEIKHAFSKTLDTVPEQDQNLTVVMDKCLHDSGYAKNQSSPPRPPIPVVIYAAISSATFGIVVYIIRIFRQYCWPWILQYWKRLKGSADPNEEAPELDQSESSFLSLSNFNAKVDEIKTELSTNQAKLEGLVIENTASISELKSDIVSLRKMILSKDSFPLPDTAIMPSWQIKRKKSYSSSTTSSPENIQQLKPVESFEKISSASSASGQDVIDFSQEVSVGGEQIPESCRQEIVKDIMKN